MTPHGRYNARGWVMKKAKIKPQSKIWLELDGAYLLGDGRARLLHEIDRLGSISEAARELGMSYRHAWGQVKKIEDRLGASIVETARGGKEGGWAKLTENGRDLLNTYRQFREDVARVIDERFRRHFGLKKRP